MSGGGARALHSLCFCHNNNSYSSSSSSSSSSLPTTTQKPSTNNNNNNLSTKPKTLLLKNLPLSSESFKEKILCLEIMGIDAGKALSQNPSLHTATLNSIQTTISFLQSKAGIHQKDMARIFGMCPKILTSNIQTDLSPVFDFLYHDLNVPRHNYRKVINKCPRLLVSSVRNQLKPALFYLQRLGFHDLEALAYHDSVLLVSNVENTLIPKMEYLVKNMGFGKDEAVEMVLRCPGLFTFSIENNFKPKFGYFVDEMDGDLEELKEFPQYFAFSLEKRIKPRYMEMVESGVKVPLALMLKSTDEQFMDLIRSGGNGNGTSTSTSTSFL